MYGVSAPWVGWRVGAFGHLQELTVGGGGGAGHHDLLLMAGLAGDLAAPFKLTLAGCDHFNNLLLHMEPT